MTTNRPINSSTLSRRGALAAGAAVLSVALAGCTGRFPGVVNDGSVTTESSTSVHSVRGVDAIEIEHRIGDVTVRGGDTDAVRLDVVKRSRRGQRGFEEVTVVPKTDHGTLRFVTQDSRPADVEDHEATVVDLTFTVPMGAGAPSVTEVSTLVGDVVLRDTRGDAVVATNVGDVVVSDVDGFCSLYADIGNVRATGVTGVDTASTDTGDIVVELGEVRNDVILGADIGDIDVSVAAGLGLDVRAASDVRVRSTLPVDVTTETRRSLEGRLHGGGYLLHAFTGLGEVTLRPLDA